VPATIAGVASGSRRLIGLDLLRCLAVTLVILRHIGPAPAETSSVWRIPFEVASRGGWTGVDLFFVLSGFLVAGLLFDEFRSHGHFSPWRFYIRRGWKIYPPFYAFIAVSCLAPALLPIEFPPVKAVLGEVFFLQNYWASLWGHTWSLAVEEHFYLLLPLVLFWVLAPRELDARTRRFTGVAAAVALGALVLRLATWQAHPAYTDIRLLETHLYPTHLRLDSLFFGVALAYLHHFHGERWRPLLRRHRWSLLTAGCLLWLPAFALSLEGSGYLLTFGLSQLSIGCGLVLIAVLEMDLPSNGALAAAAWVGAFSYSIYLWHLAVFTWILPLLERGLGFEISFLPRAVLALLISFGLGITMGKLIEVPSLRLRDRYFPSQARAISTAN
jgi:peptidoglycan/LPS O-acetylase OafA/YrhL